MKSENNIPKFDLAEQILAEHRKSASVKRKAPDKDRHSDRTSKSREKCLESEIASQIPNNQYSPTNDKKTGPEQLDTDNNKKDTDQIIAEIVSRDIQNFRSNHNRCI
jgi:cell shape-determining protein MreC